MHMNKTYCVYKHTCPNGKVYIGQTGRNPEARWGKNGYCYKTTPYFKSAIDKYGWNNISHEILYDGLTQEKACELEIKLIEKYKSNDRRYGYNLTSGGEKNFTYKHTNDERIKMMNAKRKNQHTVLQIDIETNKIIAEYENISKASRITGIPRPSISYVCNGVQLTAGGYKWIFKYNPIKYSGCRNEKYNRMLSNKKGG